VTPSPPRLDLAAHRERQPPPGLRLAEAEHPEPNQSGCGIGLRFCREVGEIPYTTPAENFTPDLSPKDAFMSNLYLSKTFRPGNRSPLLCATGGCA
jgi:hypothetical protein